MVVLSIWLVTTFFLPPDPEWHVLFVTWRLSLAAVVAALLGWSLYKCGTSEARDLAPPRAPHVHARVSAHEGSRADTQERRHFCLPRAVRARYARACCRSS